MSLSSQIENKDKVEIDYSDNPELRQLFDGDDVASKGCIKLEYQVIGKTPDKITLSLERVIRSSRTKYEDLPDEDKDLATTAPDKPILMRMKSGKNGGSSDPQPVRNSLGGTSYA